MKKSLKLLSIVIVAMVLVMSVTSPVFAAGTDLGGLVEKIEKTDVGDNTENAAGLVAIAAKVLSLVQIASAVLAVVLVAVFGFKFIMGSANEKADYQKSFIPLIVGIVVVFSATSIAKLLFGLIG